MNRFAIVLLLAFMLSACDNQGKDLMEHARKAYADQKHDEALKLLREAKTYLKDMSDSANFEKLIVEDYAKRLTAQARLQISSGNIGEIDKVYLKAAEISSGYPAASETVKAFGIEYGTALCKLAEQNESARSLEKAEPLAKRANELTQDCRVLTSIRTGLASELVARATELVETGGVLEDARAMFDRACSYDNNPESAACKQKTLVAKEIADAKAASERLAALKEIRKKHAQQYAEIHSLVHAGNCVAALGEIEKYLAELDAPEMSGLREFCKGQIASAEQQKRMNEIRSKIQDLSKTYYATVTDVSGSTTFVKDIRYGGDQHIAIRLGASEQFSEFNKIRSISLGDRLPVGDRVCTFSYTDNSRKTGRCSAAYYVHGLTSTGKYAIVFEKVATIAFDHDGNPKYCPIENVLHYTTAHKCAVDGSNLVALDVGTNQQALEDATKSAAVLFSTQDEVVAALSNAQAQGGGSIEKTKNELIAKYGHAVVSNAIKRLPVYDPDSRKIISFDTYAKQTITSLGGDTKSGNTLERDPVGTAYDLMFRGGMGNQKLLNEIRRVK